MNTVDPNYKGFAQPPQSPEYVDEPHANRDRYRRLHVILGDANMSEFTTYLKVGTLWRYLAVVMDKCSRRIVGWSFGRHKDARLTLRALNHAVYNRRPPPGLIFHTDRGIEYAGGAFTQRIAQLGFTQSMNRPGKVTDNAFVESFFHSMKAEAFHGNRFDQDQEVVGVLRRYLPFYNRDRLHSSLNYVSPMTYEQQLP